MSSVDDSQERIKTRIRGITDDGSDEQERLLDAVDTVPFRRLEEIQLEQGLVVGVRAFERDVRQDFEDIGMQMSPTSSWIRGHLEFVDEDSLHRMWKRYLFFITSEIPQYDGPSYDAFRTHIWRLKEASLVRPTRKEPASAPGRKARQFYELVDERRDHRAWDDVTGYLYERSTPTRVTETVDRLIIENGEAPTETQLALALGMDDETLRIRLRQWSLDLEERAEEVLSLAEEA